METTNNVEDSLEIKCKNRQTLMIQKNQKNGKSFV